jgi:hypothetical protein
MRRFRRLCILAVCRNSLLVTGILTGTSSSSTKKFFSGDCSEKLLKKIQSDEASFMVHMSTWWMVVGEDRG